MHAYGAVATAPWKVEYLPVEAPEPGDEDVVIQLTHSWISNGTEGSFVRGERIGGDTPRSDQDPMPFPHISGYQKVGVVTAKGSRVDRFDAGDIVFATVSRTPGLFYDHGGHINPAVTHYSQVWKLPEGADPVVYCGMVLTQVGYNVGIRGEVRPGDFAVVLGDGMVGQWSAQTLQQRGARVMLVGRHDYRLAMFDCHEGDVVVNECNCDVKEAVRSWATGGVQIVADTVGSLDAVYRLMPTMRHSSHLISAGFYGPNGKIDIQVMRNYEMTLHTPAGWSKDRMDATLAWISSGKLTTKHLITHRFPAAECGKAFDLILKRPEPVLGVVLDW